jgi:nicotinamidase-related amidase
VRNRPALLLIDFINTLDFDGGEKLAKRALAAARHTQRLKEQARAERIPVIYVNDHFGDWSANFDAVRSRCERSSRGGKLATLLAPTHADLSILKPRHSAFYGTPLEFLLDELKVDSLILTGMQAHICILFSAHDAYLRRYPLWVPAECVASETVGEERTALRHMAGVTSALVQPYSKLPRKASLRSVFDGQGRNGRRLRSETEGRA